ncbi:uncharacterized protein GGS22DRAFT_143847 [Annulohypoxylon maeteangense]|uniref:uncharacterized protein n=1 Tax=Annulohypoxylon maeteangense TaxID=1927788 RepID=UPI002008DAFA|nr:uncharacterized protein GGS22DRAFT_143847 [Annulohypoxylon maeteangense]KAI0884533.1 hypothetical protein GGS22DRAFT_143847 [Annulohypoxylon maeteangense]
MAGYNPPGGGTDPNGLHAMLARLQAQRNGDNNDDSAPANDILSRFNSYNQGANPQDYYGHSGAESPLTGIDDFLPAAPTPPSNNFSHSHHPTGPMGLGPIGTMPSNPTGKVDQSANLLNLLKFSGQNSGPHAQQVPSHTSPPGHAHTQTHTQAPGVFEGLPNLSQPHNQPPIHAPVPMPADPQGLLATLMKGNLQNESARAEPQAPAQAPAQLHAQPNWNAGPPPTDTQAYLLNLLHRPKPSQTDQNSPNEPSHPSTLTPQSANGSSTEHHMKEYMPLKPTVADNGSHEATPMPFRFGSKEHVDSPPTKFEYNSPSSQHSQYDGGRKHSKFDYANPLEAFGVSSPQDAASKSSTPGASAYIGQVPTELPASSTFRVAKKTPSVASSSGLGQDHKRLSSQRSPIMSPEHIRRKLDDAASPHSITEHPIASGIIPNFAPGEEKSTETVADAITVLAGQADKEAQEALQRAEDEEVRAKINAELDHMMRAKTDAEFQDSAEAAARDIRAELEKEENAHVLEETYSPGVAQAIRDIVDDVAHGPVADSWESAEADEIVVIEEIPNPVKVYNFPMKPWISITMLDTDSPRPQFRDEVILDIARLKKEFDQIDRNLVTATESYMVYGMSKAGGLRVIRQDDGKDAKLFTDTKDRIFNVAMSSTSPDLQITPKESIIGTGISGTVYYIQIKNGEKDHLEDAHPEQYGFILPPLVISHEGGGDNGGVLKTRARTSSTHPEFFAVGRGKTINIIWPSYIMQNGIFKSGHDRVVDTQRLYKECSLRISTGKAGKDFTFSQDDTTIVSLDKSGRVKFWDVRDLTAADENSDPWSPLPAHTSLEVKEPLMTLNTTPEGEKAWPTSVLLLDKQRPYQKGWALRYMIVGMKQNHTLQLWDLALGKPVQEFNLPHMKESDPVCSVMYHPPSGMIVVGHPMRNSIYFLHLSAPKYTIKGLSQVDYIQKLVAKDSSIPEPDSTAVISGVREYSFANKGMLRSLDILVNPATASDSEEPSLFELYAMHSKGVTGIVIKQSELGWSKDNKVIDGADASEVGLVKIAKLKELPSPLVTEPQSVDEHAPLPLRVRSVKETPPPASSSISSNTLIPQKGDENAPVGQHERKETVAPSAPISQLDKTEKKARKKREKAAAAAAAAAEKLGTDNVQSNGTSPPTSTKHNDTKSGSSSQQIMSHESIQSTVKQIVSSLGDKLTGVITGEFKDHRDNVDVEFRARDETFVKNQQILLEKVSNVLNANVQAVLTKTINDQFESSVVPVLSGLITKTISEQIDGKMVGRVSHSIQNQMQKLIPNAVNQALQKPEITKSISDKVASNVAHDIEKSVRQTLINNITPLINDTAVNVSRSVVQEVQDRTASQIAEMEQRRIADGNKIDQLTALVTSLSDTVTAMATTQAQFQDGLLKLQHHTSRDRGSAAQSTHSAHSQPPAQSHHPSSIQSQSFLYGSPTGSSGAHQLVPFQSNNSNIREQAVVRDPQLQHMIASVASYIERGEYETGLVRWIQQGRQAEVFDEYLHKLDPQFLQDVPTLVSLSVGSVVIDTLDPHLVREKLNWLETVLHILIAQLPRIVSFIPHPMNDLFNQVSPQDSQVRDVVPNLMTSYLDRFEKLYIQVAGRSSNDPIIARLSTMTSMASQIKEAVHRPNY